MCDALTQIRRVAKLPKGHCPGWTYPMPYGKRFRIAGSDYPDNVEDEFDCPLGEVGGEFYLRESICIDDAGNSGFGQSPYAWHVNYPDGTSHWKFSKSALRTIGKKPASKMPKWAARVVFEIVAIRIERLNDMKPEDAVKSGMRKLTRKVASDDHGIAESKALERYQAQWDKRTTDAKHFWQANPWVWVIDIQRIEA